MKKSFKKRRFETLEHKCPICNKKWKCESENCDLEKEWICPTCQVRVAEFTLSVLK